MAQVVNCPAEHVQDPEFKTNTERKERRRKEGRKEVRKEGWRMDKRVFTTGNWVGVARPISLISDGKFPSTFGINNMR
jgi:hypothetical protein